MQDKILLGFLMSGSRTGYQIKTMMEKSTDFFFSTSFGSIYPAFSTLTNQGLAEVAESIENGKLKKNYTITEKGRGEFLEWLEKTPGISRIRDEALLKIFFHHYLPVESRLNQIEAYSRILEDQAKSLEEIEKQIPADKADPFNMLTLRFGIDYYRWIRTRFLQLAHEIESISEGEKK